VDTVESARQSLGAQYDYEAAEHIMGDYQTTRSRRDFAAMKVERALAALDGLPPGSRVLDLGCGAGGTTRSLVAARPDLAVSGCDFSRAAIAAARSFGDDIPYAVADATALPYADGSLDAVIVYDVLEHIPDVGRCLAEIARVLRPGGVLAGTVPMEGQPGTFEWLRWKLGWQADLKAVAKGHVHRFTNRGLRTLFRRHGLRPVRWLHSFHILGQVWDFWYYYAQHRWGGVPGAPSGARPTRVRRLWWRLLASVFGPLQRVAYWESRLLAGVPLAMAVDFACRKGRKRPARTISTGSG
jgi:SAM-dependent methyltransferase